MAQPQPKPVPDLARKTRRPVFNTLSYTRRLERGGVPRRQAEAHADALAEALDALATREDVDAVKASVMRLERSVADLEQWVKDAFARQEQWTREEFVRQEQWIKEEFTRQEQATREAFARQEQWIKAEFARQEKWIKEAFAEQEQSAKKDNAHLAHVTDQRFLHLERALEDKASKADVERLYAAIRETQVSTLKWMIGTMTALFGALAAFLALLNA